eukprot:TRINITY_DN10421_c0_g1_i1.p1 TRINITY_DN10421_c0_g1~~TRINITY_DN10421_c0_g1_i1.p1  ORF type:complete len:232 (+),score=26.84 TRINITY_DN10421_c0_g1_i1:60-698(+)
MCIRDRYMGFFMPAYNKYKSKFYTLEHDRYLIYINFLEGYQNWTNIRMAIKRDQWFKFDHFLKSRSDQDLTKRLQSLIRVLEKEKEGQGKNEAGTKKMDEVLVDDEEEQTNKGTKKKVVQPRSIQKIEKALDAEQKEEIQSARSLRSGKTSSTSSSTFENGGGENKQEQGQKGGKKNSDETKLKRKLKDTDFSNDTPSIRQDKRVKNSNQNS